MANVSLSDDRLVSVNGDNANVDDGDGAAADDDDGGVDNNVHDVDDANNEDLCIIKPQNSIQMRIQYFQHLFSTP